MSYDNTNSFVLFKNDKKENENQPAYTGKITLADGTEKRLAAWIKEGKSGKFMSGKISDFQNQQPKPQPAPADDMGGDPYNDDIPFAQFMRGMMA